MGMLQRIVQQAVLNALENCEDFDEVEKEGLIEKCLMASGQLKTGAMLSIITSSIFWSLLAGKQHWHSFKTHNKKESILILITKIRKWLERRQFQ